MQLVYDSQSVVDAVVGDVNKRDKEVENIAIYGDSARTTQSVRETNSEKVMQERDSGSNGECVCV